MIKVNEYLEGRVKSLGFELDGTQHTVGVMLPGEYSFDTEKEEHITVTIGGFEIRPPGADWKTAKTGETVVIPASSRFDLKVKEEIGELGSQSRHCQVLCRPQTGRIIRP